VLHGVTCIRRLLSKESQPPVAAVLQSGVLQRLVVLLDCGDAKVQFEAAWAITNIASTEYTAEVVKANAVPALVRGMANADANLREQSLWCIGNVAGESPEYRDLLLGTPGCLEALLQNLAYPANVGLLRNATWTLSNLCRGKPSPAAAHIAAMLPALAHLANNEDQAVLVDAAWGLSYLTDGEERAIEAVVATPGVVRRCVELMAHGQPLTVVTPALRIVGNLISGSDRQTQAAVDAGALRAVVPLLSHAKRNIRREACWAISNVAAGTRAQIDHMMTVPGLVQGVVSSLRTGEWVVRKEACWVVFNVATTGTPEHVRQLVASEVIEPLASMLEAEEPRILVVALDAVAAVMDAVGKLGEDVSRRVGVMFEEAGALDSLENLQTFADMDVYNKAVAILEKHFSAAEDADDEAGGAADEVPAAAHALVQAAAAGGGGAQQQLFAFAGAAVAAAPPAAPPLGFGMGAPGMVFGNSINANANASAVAPAGVKAAAAAPAAAGGFAFGFGAPAAAPVAAPVAAAPGGFNFGGGFTFA